LRKFRQTKASWLREREERYFTIAITAIIASKTKFP
jgi:hypothetical protein